MLIETKELYHLFNKGTPIEKEALSGVNLKIDAGEFIALIGETGSGKTTLALHLNGILIPTAGSVQVGDFVVGPSTKKTGILTERVGLVFQYPEHQLFEMNVENELKFGLRHKKEKVTEKATERLTHKLTEEEIDTKVRQAAELVNLDYDALKDRSPFTLSGGEQRKVAIASILSVDQEILIFDEPTQGLDAESRGETIASIEELNKAGKTVIIITHIIEEIVNVTDRIIILGGGKIVADCKAADIFLDHAADKYMEPFLPEVTELLLRLKQKGWNVNASTYKAKDALKEILSELKKEDTTGSGRFL